MVTQGRIPRAAYTRVCITATLMWIVIGGLAVSLVGALIFGGIWWGRLRKGPEYISGRPRQLWQVTLAMWICCLVTPPPLPLICICILAAWTTKSECNKLLNDLDAVDESHPYFYRIVDWSISCEIKSGEKGCIDYICSGIPHKLMIAFSVMGFLGTAMSIYYYLVITQRVQCCCW